MLPFLDYGESWLDSREGTFADFVPREKDFGSASIVLSKIEKKIAESELELNGESKQVCHLSSFYMALLYHSLLNLPWTCLHLFSMAL